MYSGFISADSHIIEPGNLWLERLDAKWRDVAPRAQRNEQNGHWYFVGPGMPGGTDLTHSTSPGMSNDEVDAKVAGLGPDAGPPESPPAQQRLLDLWRDSTFADVLYSTCAFELYHLEDPALKAACFEVYNSWIAEFCAADPDRLIGTGLLSIDDVKRSVQELQRCRSLGLRSMMIPARPLGNGRLDDELYEPLWAAAAEADMVLAMHVSTGKVNSRLLRESYANVLYFDVAYQEELKQSISEMIAGQVFDRHPNLKLVAAEGGFDYAAGLAAKMDKAHNRWHERWGRAASPRPSELYGENIFFTFIIDQVGLLTLPYGIERAVMWSSDYPHRNSTWPHSQERVYSDFNGAGVPEATADLLLRGNVARIYGIDLAAIATPSPLIAELV